MRRVFNWIMAQIELRLSNKTQKETGRREILIRFYQGNKFDLYAKSEVYISPDYFEYYIDRKKTEASGVKIPSNTLSATEAEAAKRGFLLRKSGFLAIKKRIETIDVKYHREQESRINSLKDFIIGNFEKTEKTSLTSDWLKEMVDRFHYPEKYTVVKKHDLSFYDLVEKYIMERQLADGHARVFRVLAREVSRYEGFVKAMKKKNFSFNINTITREDIEDFSDYLRNEKELSEEYPQIFASLINHYPASVKNGHSKLDKRGENTVIKAMARLKSLFRFFYDRGETTNRPFDGVKIGVAKVGTPYYITIAERNTIANADIASIWEKMDKKEQQKARMPLETLITQRDIFVFHCFVGCRVGDLMRLTPKHIQDGILVYTPHKTKDEGDDAVQARVPLHPKALELIKQYREKDNKGRLFPFISAQRYNDAIKMIFTMAGVNREVEVRNPLTGNYELRPINEIASSHLARRTFIGNAYFKVSDPNIIGKMSGHVDGSKAFKRYRNIEDDTLKKVIDLLD